MVFSKSGFKAFEYTDNMDRTDFPFFAEHSVFSVESVYKKKPAKFS